MKALRFEAVFGVIPGHENELSDGATADVLVARAWIQALETEQVYSGMVVGGVAVPGRVGYPTGFGCPVSGEVVAVVSGNSNPKFVPEEKLFNFRESVIRVAGIAKKKLGQARVEITFIEVDSFVYLEPKDSGGTQIWGF